MAIEVTSKPSEVSPHIELQYRFSELMPYKTLYLRLSQARALSLELDRAVDEFITARKK